MKKFIFVSLLVTVFILAGCTKTQLQQENLAIVLSVDGENSITVEPLWDFEGYEEVVVHFDEDTKWFDDDVELEEGQTIGLILHNEIMESFPPQVVAKEVTSIK